MQFLDSDRLTEIVNVFFTEKNVEEKPRIVVTRPKAVQVETPALSHIYIYNSYVVTV
jgi:hypothetical protein